MVCFHNCFHSVDVLVKFVMVIGNMSKGGGGGGEGVGVLEGSLSARGGGGGGGGKWNDI